MGQGSHQPQGNPLALSGEPENKQRPLAPAPLPVLAGVVASVSMGAVIIDLLIANDYAAVFAFVAVMTCGVVVLNRAGVRRAQAEPHHLYRKFQMPSDPFTRKVRAGAIISTLVLLVLVVSALAEPGEVGSPLPYFIAVVFVYLVVPQLNGRLAVRRYDNNQK